MNTGGSRPRAGTLPSVVGGPLVRIAFLLGYTSDSCPGSTVA